MVQLEGMVLRSMITLTLMPSSAHLGSWFLDRAELEIKHPKIFGQEPTGVSSKRRRCAVPVEAQYKTTSRVTFFLPS